MKTSFKSATAGLLLLMLALGGSAGATCSATMNIVSFTIDTTLVLGLYNSVDQNTNQITTFPKEFVDQYKGVIAAQFQNTSSTDTTPTFDLYLYQDGALVAHTTNGSLTLTSPVPHNSIKSITAADLKASASFGGTIDPAFQKKMSDTFQNIDPNKLKDVVSQFISMHYRLCLVPYVPCGQQSCWDVTIFKEDPSARCIIAMLVTPHNQGIPNRLPFFLWTPASMDLNCNATRVPYRLDIMEEMDSMPIAQIMIPEGQNYYQWSTNDRSLIPGKKYYWRVVELDCSFRHQPFCGPNGRGWNIIKWFICGGDPTPACVYNAQEVDLHVRADADTSDSVKKALAAWTVSSVTLSSDSDPDLVCKYLNGLVKVKSVKFNLQ